MIETHDIVVLMKIGDRLPAVLALLHQMGIADQCVFGRHVGMADAILCANVAEMDPEKKSGLSLNPPGSGRIPLEKRHLGAQ